MHDEKRDRPRRRPSRRSRDRTVRRESSPRRTGSRPHRVLAEQDRRDEEHVAPHEQAPAPARSRSASSPAAPATGSCDRRGDRGFPHRRRWPNRCSWEVGSSRSEHGASSAERAGSPLTQINAAAACAGRYTCVQSPQVRGREIGHARKRTRRPDSGSAGALVPARRDAVAEPGAEQGHRIQRSRARRARPEGAAAAARVQPGGTGQPRPGQLSSPRQPAREIHLPDLAARSQRSTLLSHPHGESRRDAADRLHADGGTRLREVRPHLPAAARDLRHGRGPRPGEGAPSQLAASGCGDDRRHRRRAHPRPRRPGIQRHGNSGRQALALHRLRRHPPHSSACR